MDGAGNRLMIGSFKTYIEEAANKRATFVFGRFNPPTNGHEKLFQALKRASGKGQMFIYASQSNDPKKNPLEYKEKIKFMRKMFPKYGRAIQLDTKIKTAMHVASSLYEKGFTEVTMVAGSDRVLEFETLLNKYNNVKGRHGFYNFEDGVKVVSAGERDPDGEGVTGMSASKMRGHASQADLESFTLGMPNSYKPKSAKLMNAVRKGMGLIESKVNRLHVELESVSDEREQYISGNLFEVNDRVVINKTEETGAIQHLGSNYVIVDLDEGIFSRQWIDSITKIGENK